MWTPLARSCPARRASSASATTDFKVVLEFVKRHVFLQEHTCFDLAYSSIKLDLVFRQWDPVCKQGNRNSGGSSWNNRGYYRFVQQVLYMMPIRLVEVEVESRVCYIPVWSECGNIWHLFHRNLVTDNNGQFPEQDEVRSSILQELPKNKNKRKMYYLLYILDLY